MILILIIFAIYCAYRSYESNQWSIDGPLSFVMFAVFGGIGCTLLLMVPIFILGLIAYNNAEWAERQTGSWGIISVERESQISGHFVLGTGSIKSYPVYYYYTGGNGNYQLNWKMAHQTSIHERTDMQPQVTTYAKFTDNYILRFLESNIPFVVEDHYSCSKDERAELTIPVNSIRREFHP
jgi:hypothetical protein